MKIRKNSHMQISLLHYVTFELPEDVHIDFSVWQNPFQIERWLSAGC